MSGLVKGLTILAVVLGLTACTQVSVSSELGNRGIQPTTHFKLLNLKYKDEVESHWSVGGAYLFFVGGVGGGGSTEIKGKIGFVFQAHDQIVMLKVNANDLNYYVDNSLEVPEVRFSCPTRKSYDGGYDQETTTNLFSECTVNLYLSLKNFNNDVQVLKYAG